MVRAGIILVLAGAAIAGIANVVWPPPRLHPGLHASPDDAGLGLQLPALHLVLPSVSQEVWEAAVGVALTLLAMLLLAGRLVSEELLLTRSSLHPLQACCLRHSNAVNTPLHHAECIDAAHCRSRAVVRCLAHSCTRPPLTWTGMSCTLMGAKMLLVCHPERESSLWCADEQWPVSKSTSCCMLARKHVC